LIGLSNILLS